MDTYKRLPIRLVKGKGVWVWDDSGNKFLDSVSGIATCTLGHSDRNLRLALTKQLKKIQHISNIYSIPEQEELAKWLVKNSCAEKVFFCNSGAEANEAAIKLARKYSKMRANISHPIILSTKQSFHGRTIAALSATGQFQYHKGFDPLVDGFKFFPYNDIDAFKKIYDETNKQVCAVIIEPIQGEGGINIGEKVFFQELRDFCSKNNILLILDEVQTGMGRTGKLWGYENLNIEPDIFTIAKGLGGGHAIGACLTTKKSDVFEFGDHASTFGGNPFACTAGLTVAKELERRNLLLNSRERGLQLNEGLKRIHANHQSLFNQVRGVGLMQGLEINFDNTLTTEIFINKALSSGLLIASSGQKVLRFVPPLIIKKRQVEEILKRLEKTINSL